MAMRQKEIYLFVHCICFSSFTLSHNSRLLTGMDTLTSFKTLKQIYWYERDREREKKTVKETRDKKKAKNDKKNWSINLTSKLDKNL